MKLTDNEIRDITNYLEEGKSLPEKYRYLLFEEKREVELLWNGKTNETIQVVLPFQTIEQVDEPRKEGVVKQKQTTIFDVDKRGRQLAGWTNKLIWGDNKIILSSLKNGPLREAIEKEGGIKLIYIDPPFDVGANFSMKIEVGEETFTKEANVLEEIAYRDTWGKGADSYLAMIYERLKLMRDLLSEDGTIYVHCDWRLDAHMRLVLDELFGKKNFRNQIIWHYDIGTAPKKDFKKKHDIIFRYSKSEKYFFNEIKIPPHNINRYDQTDENGRKYMIRGDTGKKVYADEGQPEDDVWTFLKTKKLRTLNSMSDERKILDIPLRNQSIYSKELLKHPRMKEILLLIFFAVLVQLFLQQKKWVENGLGQILVSLLSIQLERG